MLIGRAVGLKFGKAAEIVGGVALIGLGTMILMETSRRSGLIPGLRPGRDQADGSRSSANAR